MKTSSRIKIFAAAVAAIFLVDASGAESAWCQVPKTIKIIAPFPPGGPASILARLLGDQIERAHNITVVVENRPGGGGVIGAEAVARSAPDGATLLMHNPSIIINSHLRKQNYDPISSFTPICKVADLPLFIAANSASPYRSVAELIGAARESPGKLTVAALTATPSHIGFSLIRREANVDITFVPFPGTAPMINALLGEHITAMMDNYGGMAEQVKAGKLRPLATLSPTRTEGLGDIPTLAESGYPDIAIGAWFGLFAPANLKPEVASRLIEWVSIAMKEQVIRERITPLGMYPGTECGAEFASLMRKQMDVFGTAIREANILAQ